MLVAPGQPVEVERSLVDVDGQPFDPASPPTAAATAGGRAYPSLDPIPADPVACTVRRIEAGLYAARVPAAVLATIGPAAVAWSWEDDGEQSAVDVLEVTPFPVATPDDLARLPGAKVSASTLQEKLRALSAATRDFEGATNVTFSPRLCEMVGLRLPTIEDTDGRSVVAEPLTDGTTRYLYVAGLPAPPDDVVRAVAVLASSYVADGPWDDRGVAIDGGGGAMRLLTAGVGRAKFSIPVVEAAAKRWYIPVFA